MTVKDYQWDSIMALVGPATHAVNVGSGATSGTIPFVTNATTECTREILIGGSSDGNIRVSFISDTATSVTIPVKAGQRYPWACDKIYIAATSAVDNIWVFY